MKKDKSTSIRYDFEVDTILNKWIQQGKERGDEINRSKIFRKLVLDKDRSGGYYDQLDNQMAIANKILDKMNGISAREIEKIFTKAENYTQQLNNNNYKFTTTEAIKQIRNTLAKLKELNATKQFNDLLAALQRYDNINSNYTLEETLTKRQKDQQKKETLQKKKNRKKTDKLQPKETKELPTKPQRSREEKLATLRRNYTEMPLKNLVKGRNDPNFDTLPEDERKIVLEILDNRLEQQAISDIQTERQQIAVTTEEGSS